MKNKFLLVLSLLFIVLIFIDCNDDIKSHVQSIDGVKIVFDYKGTGDTAIVFVHGWSRNKNDWLYQANYFSKNYKTVAIDLAGHGESGSNRETWSMAAYSNDVLSVISYLNLDNIILVGHSMGTPIILKAAKQIPEKVIGIVPVDMLHDVGTNMSDGFIDTMSVNIMNMISNPTEDVIKTFYKKEVADSTVQGVVEYYKKVDKVGLQESIKNVLYWISNEQIIDISNVTVPITCINSDLRIPNKNQINKYSNKFDYKIICGVGHWVMAEAPDEFNKLLDEIIFSLKRE